MNFVKLKNRLPLLGSVLHIRWQSTLDDANGFAICEGVGRLVSKPTGRDVLNDEDLCWDFGGGRTMRANDEDEWALFA